MATIVDLHSSISEMSDKNIFTHIRHLRNLRRELPAKVAKKTIKKAKQNKKQITIKEYLDDIKGDNRDKLLKKLLEIRKGRQKG